jgi:hypothetical protein
MAKYIDANRLKAEIHKRKKSLLAGICGEAFTRKQKNEMLVASEELDRFNRIIDSIQQEQPIDLEKEIENCFDGWYNDVTYGDCVICTKEGCSINLEDVRHIARHFYSLGCKAKKEYSSECPWGLLRKDRHCEYCIVNFCPGREAKKEE